MPVCLHKACALASARFARFRFAKDRGQPVSAIAAACRPAARLHCARHAGVTRTPHCLSPTHSHTTFSIACARVSQHCLGAAAPRQQGLRGALALLLHLAVLHSLIRLLTAGLKMKVAADAWVAWGAAPSGCVRSALIHREEPVPPPTGLASVRAAVVAVWWPLMETGVRAPCTHCPQGGICLRAVGPAPMRPACASGARHGPRFCARAFAMSKT